MNKKGRKEKREGLNTLRLYKLGSTESETLQLDTRWSSGGKGESLGADSEV